MFIRPLRLAPARQAAASLGWLAETVAAPAIASRTMPRHLGLVLPEPRQAQTQIELVSAEAAAAQIGLWRDLVSRSLEPNVFLDPDFVLPAVQHIISARRPAFLCVKSARRGSEAPEFIGLAALHLPRRFGASRLAKAWCPPQAALGLPLLDRTRGGEALDLMLAWLGQGHAHASALLFPNVPAAGPTMALIRARAAAGALRCESFDPRARAVLGANCDVPALLERGLSSKRLKKIERQRIRLARLGTLAYIRGEATQVKAAAERFLALEASGWKGARGTALLSDPGLTTFARSMTRLLARGGKCRIDGLYLDGEPIAMGIFLTSGRHAFVWKVAYDERYAAFSPGLQFMVDFMRRQTADPAIDRTDSCAIPDHPMIDRLWPDRLDLADIFVAPSTTHSEAFAAMALRERVGRGLRARAKKAYYALKGGRPS